VCSSYLYSLPPFLLQVANILRSCGRLFWPAYYLIFIAALYGVVRLYKKETAQIILACAFIIQITDTSAGWWGIHQKLSADSQKQDIFTELLAPLNDPFWMEAPKHYSNLYRVKRKHDGWGWETFATYASRYQMSTNSVYLARVDSRKLDAMNAKFEHSIITGQYDPHSLYIVDDEKILPVLMHLDTSKDVFARINGVNVLAPGWRTCTSCPPIPKEPEIHSIIPAVVLDQQLDFSSKGLGKSFLVGICSWPITGWGWSFPEAFGTWSEGSQAKIVMPLPDGAKTLTLEMRALVSPNHPKQTIAVQVDGKLQQTAILAQDQGNLIEIALPPKTAEKDYVTIDLQFKDQAKPKNLALGDDVRELAIGLVGGVVR